MDSIETQINSNRIFIINRSNLEERLEPKFYIQKYVDNEKQISSSKFPISSLFEVTEKISDGTHYTPSYVNDGIKFISVKDVRRSAISLTDTKFITEDEADRLDRRCKPQLNDILLTKIGATFGFAAAIETEERFQIFVSLALLRPNERVAPKYLEIFLNTELAYIQFERVIKGASVPDLHLEDIRKVKIPIPPIDVQKQIVRVFQSNFSLKKKKDEDAKLLLSSIDKYLLNELGVTLPIREKSLKSRIFTISFRDFSGSRFDPFYYQNLGKIESRLFETVSLRKIANISKGQSITKDKVTNGLYPVIAGGQTSPYFHNKYNYEGNVITISASGAYAGYVWYHTNPIFASDCIVIRSKNEDEVSTKFIYHVLKALQSEIYKLQQGAGQPHVYSRDIEKIPIPTPSREKQDEIIANINAIQNKISKLQRESSDIFLAAENEVKKMILG